MALVSATECVSSDLSDLEKIRNLHLANYGGIYSWEGKAVVSRTYETGKIILDFPKLQYTEYLYSFTVDRRNRSFLSIGEIRNNYSIFDKERVRLHLSNQSYLYSKDILYSMNWYSHDSKGFAVGNNGAFVPEDGHDIERIAVVSHSLPEDIQILSDYFDPFSRKSYEHTDVYSIVDNMIKTMTALNFMRFDSISTSDSKEHTRLTSNNGNLTLEFQISSDNSVVERRFVFNLNQKANVILYEYSRTDASKLVDSVVWKSNYQLVNGFWIPKKTSLLRKNAIDDFSISETIDWDLNKINETLATDAFSPQRFGLHRGDILYDERTGQKTIVTGDDFPPPFHSNDTRKARHPVVRYGLMSVGLIMIMIWFFLKYRQWLAKCRKGE